MRSIITITAPAENNDLVDLETVKADLGLVSDDEDERISQFIRGASATIESYCGRTFAVETITEQFRKVDCVAGLMLGRWPVVSIEAVVIDGESIPVGQFEYDRGSGILCRIDDDADEGIPITGRKVIVEYSTGYAVIPAGVERACIDLVRLMRAKSSRDPMVKSMTIPEVVTESYWIGGVPGEANSRGLPSDITANLKQYVIRNVLAV